MEWRGYQPQFKFAAFAGICAYDGLDRVGPWNDNLCFYHQIPGSNGIGRFRNLATVIFSAVPYPLKEVKTKMPEYAWIVEYNPLTHIIEGFRYMILDTGTFTWFGFSYTLVISILLFLIGLIVFNRTEKNFIDTV